MTEISREGLGIWRYRSSPWRVAGYTVAIVALLATAGLWSLRALLFDENFHTVIPNEVYRSAQPSPVALERRIRELGLRSVINLRGRKGDSRFNFERVVTEAHGADYHLVSLSGPMPTPAALRRLVHLLDTARRPLLLHCAAGIHRSGIGSAVAVLLAGGDVVEARKQFGLTYGFVPWSRRCDLPKVLDDYEHWLAVQGWSHTPHRFRRWVENNYIPYFYRARLEPLNVPASIAEGSSVLLRFRATNTSPQPWRFRSDRDQGVHLGAKVRLLEPGVEHEIELRGGFRDLTIAPGEAVVLELAVPPLPQSGRYQFLVDLVDENVLWFSAMGSEQVAFDLRVEASDSLSGESVYPRLMNSDGAM